jgi:hypothetical protein
MTPSGAGVHVYVTAGVPTTGPSDSDIGIDCYVGIKVGPRPARRCL